MVHSFLSLSFLLIPLGPIPHRSSPLFPFGESIPQRRPFATALYCEWPIHHPSRCSPAQPDFGDFSFPVFHHLMDPSLSPCRRHSIRLPVQTAALGISSSSVLSYQKTPDPNLGQADLSRFSNGIWELRVSPRDLGVVLTPSLDLEVRMQSTNLVP